MRLSLKSFVGVVVVAITATSTLVAHMSFNRFQEDLEGFEGLEIGQSKIDAQYARGVPDSVQGPYHPDAAGSEVSYPLRVNLFDGRDAEFGDYEGIPEGQSSLDFDQWHYRSQAKTVYVDFDPETGLLQRIQCRSDETRQDASACEPIFGITIGMQEDVLIDQLGRPDDDETLGGGQLLGAPIVVLRRLRYDDLGLEVDLQERKVSSITKMAGEDYSHLDWLLWSMGVRQ